MLLMLFTIAITKQDFLLLSIRTNFITECFLVFKILIFKIHKVKPFQNGMECGSVEFACSNE